MARFQKGDRVRMTKAARRLFPNRPIEGTVTGFQRDGVGIIVRLDGQRTNSGWSPTFWKSVRP